ncbi:MAG: LysM peptidoglycan-binding domain-containing protein [Thermoanaerobaculia bacterium]
MRRHWTISWMVVLTICFAVPAAAQCGGSVVVARGDTLSGIAARCGTTVAALVRANPSIDDPDRIYIGQRIAIATGETVRGPRIEIGPVAGAAGTSVHIVGARFPPNRTIEIGAGPPFSEYEVIARTRSDARGMIDVRVEVPPHTAGWDEVVFVAATPEANVRNAIAHFDVIETDDDGRIRVTGVVTGEGVECPQIETEDGTRYTLAGATTRALRKGDRVSVEGTIAEVSFCMQGTTIAVEKLAYIDPPRAER